MRRSRREAQAALKELRRTTDAGINPGQASTVATFMAWWLDNVLPGQVSADSITKYRWVTGKWITPHVGTVRLNKLMPGHVQAMLRRLEAHGLSPRSRALARTVVARALRWAEQTQVVGRNVARTVDGPKLDQHPSDALTAEEAEAVLAAVRGDRLEALAVVALRLGLCRGEALSLRWGDVDFDAGELTVATSKTRAGERTVPLVAGTAAALREHRRRQAGEQLAAGPRWQAAAACSRSRTDGRCTRGSRSSGGTGSPRPPASVGSTFTGRATPQRPCFSTRACPSRSCPPCSATPTCRSPPISTPASPPTPNGLRSAGSTTEADGQSSTATATSHRRPEPESTPVPRQAAPPRRAPDTRRP